MQVLRIACILLNSVKGMIVQGQDRSNAAVQKRPMRPILPAYQSTGKKNSVQVVFCCWCQMYLHICLCYVFLGRTVFQIITVPPDKGKLQTVNHNRSFTGTVHQLILFLIIIDMFILYTFSAWFLQTWTIHVIYRKEVRPDLCKVSALSRCGPCFSSNHSDSREFLRSQTKHTEAAWPDGPDIHRQAGCHTHIHTLTNEHK